MKQQSELLEKIVGLGLDNDQISAITDTLDACLNEIEALQAKITEYAALLMDYEEKFDVIEENEAKRIIEFGEALKDECALGVISPIIRSHVHELAHIYAYDKIGSTGLYHAFIAGHTAASEGMVKSNNRNEYFKDFHGGDIVKKEDVVKICNMLTIGSPTSEGSMYNQALTDILTQINSL